MIGHELVFATNNAHKLQEVQEIIGNKFRLLSLADIGFNDEIPEDFETLEENALQKAWFIYNKFNLNCFADDTGLEVEILNWEPGVRSARYAGEHKNSADNILKLFSRLEGKPNRNAQFRTVVALIIEGKEYLFEGKIEGKIIEEQLGRSGFGYDPIFVPNGYNQTFAQMTSELKNAISHRGIAIAKLSDFLDCLIA